MAVGSIHVSFEIEGMNQLKQAIQKHYQLLRGLEQNLNEIEAVCLEVQAKINQPSAGTNG